MISTYRKCYTLKHSVGIINTLLISWHRLPFKTCITLALGGHGLFHQLSVRQIRWYGTVCTLADPRTLEELGVQAPVTADAEWYKAQEK